MPDNTIDTLNIQIESNTDKATSAIEKLIGRLSDLNNSLSGLNTRGLRKYAKELDNVATSFKALNGVQMSGLDNTIGKLQSLSQIDLSNLKSKKVKLDLNMDSQKVIGVSDSIQKLSESFSQISGLDIKSTGLNSFINSLNRLASTDISKFNTTKLTEMISVMSGVSNIPDISSNVNRFVSSIAKLAGTGSSIGTVASELPKLKNALKDTVDEVSNTTGASQSVNDFVASLAKLASAGDRTGQTASQLDTLSEAVNRFFTEMQNIPEVSDKLLRMMESLSQLASSGSHAGTAARGLSGSFGSLSGTTSTLKGSLSGIVSSFKKFTSTVTNGGKKIISTFSKIGRGASNIGSKFKHFTNPLGSLMNTISSLYAKAFLVKRALSELSTPVNSAMDYVETLNYFNSAFNQVAENVDTDEWKKSGIKSAEAYANSFEERAKQLSQKLTGFNISDTGEMTRTNMPSLGLDPEKTMQYQATFAQMASSMGDTSETALKLSNALTMIGADLASVRNMEFEDVWQDMASGLTGMSRAMDKYGINIRNANMQQELYNLGIDTSISNLTQADKTILRTIILLNNSKYAWADLANTINQPANQIRMLKSNFESLGRTIGSLFIPILTKVLPYINAVTIALQRLFSYIAKLLGIKLSDFVASTGGAAIDMGNIADESDNVASGIDAAVNNAEKLKKALSVLSFDELNQLTDNTSTPTGTNASTGNVDNGHLSALDDALDKALSDYQTVWNKAFEEMSNNANQMADKIVDAFKKKDWAGLGKTVADGINIGMQKLYDFIKWENVGPKVTEFTSAFTTAFNSLVDNINWPLIGQTIGAGITTITRTFNLLTDPKTGIDFNNLGSKISQGLRGMVEEVPWTEVGNALGNGFMVAWRLFDGFVSDMSTKNDAGMTGWQQLGDAIASALNGILEKVDFGEIAHSLATSLNGAFDSLSEFTKKFHWDDLVENITTGISTFIQEFDWKENGKKLEDFLDHLLTALVDAAEDVDWEALGHNIGVFLSEIDWGKHLVQLLDTLKEVLGGIWDGLGTTSAGTFVKAIALFKVGSKLLPLVDDISKFFTGSTVVGNLSKAVQGMLGGGFESLSTTTIPIFGEALGGLIGTAGPVVLATIAAVKLSKKVASITEAMQGGNGMITQYGGYLHDFATELANVANLTNEQSEALWELIEKDEELGKSHDEMYSDMIAKLQEYGVSADQAKVALENYGTQAGVSAEFVEGMTDKIKELGEGVSQAATNFDTSKISISDLKDTLYQLSLTSDEFGGSYKTAWDEISNVPYSNTTDALDAVYTSLKNANVPLDELNQRLSKDFPDATASVKTAVKTNIVGAQETISSSVGKASIDTKEATGSMADAATHDFAEIQSKADEYLSGVNTSTVTQWGSSSEEVRRNIRQMKIDVSSGLGDIDKTVESHFSSQYNIMAKKWEKAKERITGRGQIIDSLDSELETKIPAMSKYFDQLSRNISTSMNGLYILGRNAAQQFSNGLQSVHIKTPHIYMNTSTWRNGNGYSYRWDSGVNWYRKGGLFDSASVIGVGEAGKEAVLPLENKKTMKMIADSITSNASDSGIGLSKEELTQAVAQGVAQAMMNMNTSSQGSTPRYIMNSITLDGRELAKAITKAQEDESYRMNPSPAY